MKLNRLIVIFGFLGLTWLYAGGDNLGGNILEAFKDASNTWQPQFVNAGLFLLGTLAVFEIVLVYGQMAIQGDIDYNRIIANIVKIAFLIGIFLTFIHNLDIIKSFASGLDELGNRLLVYPIDLDTIIDYALDIWILTGRAGGDFSLTSPISSFGNIFFASIAGLIAGFAVLGLGISLFVAYAKFFIVFASAPLWLGFGVFQYTRQYAINTIVTFIKIGAELLITKIIIALAFVVLPASADKALENNESLFSVIIIALVFFSLIRMISGLVESIFSGGLPANQSGFGGAARQTVAAAAGAAMGGAKGASNAIKIAQASGGGLKTKASAALAGGLSGMAKGLAKSSGMGDINTQNAGMKSGKAMASAAKFGEHLSKKKSGASPSSGGSSGTISS